MEVNNNRQPSCKLRAGDKNIFLGVLLLVVGTIWLLSNLNVIPDRILDIVLSWQMLFIVIGCYLMSARNWISGAIITFIGAFFLMINLLGVYVSFGKVIIPTLLIAIGASIIAGVLYRRSDR